MPTTANTRSAVLLAVPAMLAAVLLLGSWQLRAGPEHAMGQASSPTPADTLIGQQATACANGVQFSFQVASAEWTRSLPVADPVGLSSGTPAGNGVYVVALVDVTNQGTSSGIPAERLVLQDEHGRTFRHPDFNAVFVGALADAYGVDTQYDLYDPGITKRGIYIFEVAPDVQTLGLVGEDLGC